MNKTRQHSTLTRVGISAVIAVGLWGFTTQFSYGAYLDGLAYRLYASYANDLLQPFGLYFALCALDSFLPALRPWQRKAAITVLIPLSMEVLQIFWAIGGDNAGNWLSTADQWGLGFVFDPLDILAYIIAAFAAAGLERLLLPSHRGREKPEI
jgi:hypothetical protein